MREKQRERGREGGRETEILNGRKAETAPRAENYFQVEERHEDGKRGACRSREKQDERAGYSLNHKAFTPRNGFP